MPLSDYQVLQRDANGKARVKLATGETVELAAGGPYTIDGARHVLVGDLWLLAGQSNMEGSGRLVDLETPSPFVHSQQSREQWAIAEEPLHWRDESPYLAHHRHLGRDTLPAQPVPRDPERDWGAGLGLTFAKERYRRTGVPVGLLPSALGGTSMQQWDPALRYDEGRSFYAAAVKRVQAAGGKVAGILWYQGENDANVEDLKHYTDRMIALVRAFRADFGQPELPFYYVQLGRFVTDSIPEIVQAWNGLRESQRRLVEKIAHSAVVAAIDLELDDKVHIGTQGLKRLGRRLAAAADGHRSPLVAGAWVDGNGCRVRVTFDYVQGELRAAGRPAGFTIRDACGAELPIIYNITLDGATVTLHLTTPSLPRDTHLWYGWGTDPYCNIVAAGDAAVPAFGPLSL